MSRFVGLLILFGLLNKGFGQMSHEIDLTSITVNGDLYQICWQLIDNDKYFVGKRSIFDMKKNTTIEVKVEKRLNSDTNTYMNCIERKNLHDLYQIKLPDSKSDESLIIAFQFSIPLVTPLKLIRHKIFKQGVYFELNVDFVGISSLTSVTCQVLLYNNSKVFEKFTMTHITKSHKALLNPGDKFDFYFICNLKPLSQVSTGVIHESGQIETEELTIPLKPLVIAPFRRLIFIRWRPIKDIAVFLIEIITENGKSLKTFRIINGDAILPHKLIEKPKNSEIWEDLGYFQSKFSMVYTFLDMVEPLIAYRKYKLSIKWSVNGSIKENFIYFTALRENNCGKLNNNLISCEKSYIDLRNSVSEINQKALCSFNEIPNQESIIHPKGYGQYESFFTLTNEYSKWKPLTSKHVFKFQSDLLKNSLFLFPYFYIMVHHKNIQSSSFEILQLPYKTNSKLQLTNIEFIPNHSLLTFTITWKWSNQNSSISPAFYVIEIIEKSKNKCHGAYILKCSTCNYNYIQMTERQNSYKLSTIERNCGLFKIYEDYFQAIDTNFKFTTGKYPERVLFNLNIQYMSNEDFIDLKLDMINNLYMEFWTKYKHIVISIICLIVTLVIFVSIFYFCRRIKKTTDNPPTNDDDENNKYYDDETDM